jgi:hypothetical protein
MRDGTGASPVGKTIGQGARNFGQKAMYSIKQPTVKREGICYFERVACQIAGAGSCILKERRLSDFTSEN